ncbi:carbohydrate-binding family 9-like protein [Paenibacillus sp. CC-CFT747]|nr:carbohydrate-binding family 9-like protein [Paenibacillus sp. CC-CFT747]
MDYSLKCFYENGEEKDWERLPAVQLVDVVTGGPVIEETQVKVCWDAEALYIRFDGRDDYVVSQYTNRDDPLYEQDVVEIFIDVEGTGRHYLEFELSPHNVLFDARIDNEGGKIAVHTDWDAEGIVTSVRTNGDRIVYDWKLPFADIGQVPEEGTAWRANFYRIDDDREGKRHYQAWSPTRVANYHIPSRFGTLLFTTETP